MSEQVKREPKYDGWWHVHNFYGRVHIAKLCHGTWWSANLCAGKVVVLVINGGTPLAPVASYELVRELVEALSQMVEAECDYMKINNLGDPEKQHNVKRARAALAKAKLAGLGE